MKICGVDVELREVDEHIEAYQDNKFIFIWRFYRRGFKRAGKGVTYEFKEYKKAS